MFYKRVTGDAIKRVCSTIPVINDAFYLIVDSGHVYDSLGYCVARDGLTYDQFDEIQEEE